MKKLFYIGLTGIALFEILKVYFIMPMPGSQEINSISIAYFLHQYRWVIRIFFGLMILAGSSPVFKSRRIWWPVAATLVVVIVTYFFNFKMTAEKMFLQPAQLILKSSPGNKVSGNRLVIGVEHNKEAKAYPVNFIAYHHQVQDSIGGKPVIITYCSVCRTGRVFEPLVNGHLETFRLVGMDHFNAMFEDATTKSWWRQSTGEAAAGALKGKRLPEVHSVQMTIDKWFELYPQGLVMQGDDFSKANYDSLARFEQGRSTGSLTRTDSLPWKNKSWVAGIQIKNDCKAYDWNTLKRNGIINDSVGNTPIFLAISSDGQSFAAFERPSEEIFTIHNDTLFSGESMYDFSGKDLKNKSARLNRVQVYQEFWHSWLTFHPGTQRY